MFRTCYFLFVIASVVAACNRDKSPGLIAQELAPPIQRFPVQIGVDTIIRCAGGAVLRFCPNTFLANTSNITVEIREIKNRGQAMLAGIATLTQDGRLLETEGMIWVNAVGVDGSIVKINSSCGISVSVPTRGRRSGVKWFRGVNAADDIFWAEDKDAFVNKTDVRNLETGQQLFETLCQNCHCRALDGPLTGPALGNIQLYRDKQWLRDFTRNSQQMIKDGDSLALCGWNLYRPCVMPAFPQLIDAQIDAIYQFIGEESGRLNVDLGADYYKCNWFPPKKSDSGHASSDSPPNVQLPLIVQPPKKENPYIGKVYSLGWHNIDVFAADTTALPVQVQVNINNIGQFDDLIAGILFNRFNSNILLDPTTRGFSLDRSFPVKLPFVQARLVVFGLKGKQWYLSDLPFTIVANNIFDIDLKPVSRRALDDFIKSASFQEVEPPVSKELCSPLRSQ